jgi:hypothetical protein
MSNALTCQLKARPTSSILCPIQADTELSLKTAALLAVCAPGHRVPEDAVNTIAGKADFLRQVVVRDRTVNGNSIPDIVMVKDTEDGDVVLFLVTALAYNRECGMCDTYDECFISVIFTRTLRK